MLPLMVWGIDEVFEAIGGTYGIVIALVVLLVRLERTLYTSASASVNQDRTRKKRPREASETKSTTDRLPDGT